MQIFEKYQLIIFDLDGTITKPVHNFQEIKKTLKLPLDQDILASISATNGDQRYQLEQKLQSIEEELAIKTELQQNIESVLNRLKQKQKDLAILTRNSKHNALISLRSTNLLHLFDQEAIFGRDESAPKPDPDGIVKLMNYYNVEKINTIIIGDYKYDLQAGRNAGITTVYFDPDDDHLWDDFSDYRITDYFVTK